MILFFQGNNQHIFTVKPTQALDHEDYQKLKWLFRGAHQLEKDTVDGPFIGPRKEMITPWSTNAVEITQIMGIKGIERIEEFHSYHTKNTAHDPMLQSVYPVLDQEIFEVNNEPAPVQLIDDIAQYNLEEGLALSDLEIEYLENIASNLDRKLTDSEVFGFSQVNSEHCRHKIFNGTFIIDGKEKKSSLFELIKKTSKVNPHNLVSAYIDNVAFIKGPQIEQFAPKHPEKADLFAVEDIDTVLSLKAETHNFPTTVEPFNGASTGTGGEIRDRMAGGKASIPLAGTAVYMTSYPRITRERNWENGIAPRKWLYQTPLEILIKASNGVSDFGNKFGQPLICGSLLTFEYLDDKTEWGYDKVIMLAGGIGFAKLQDSAKDTPHKNDQIIAMGGDNYRIGMGGSAVSSVATGEYGNSIELNAVQRANPEMQKRVANVIRALAESSHNPIVAIHDHGAGGHLNCFSELVGASGGTIHLDKLPIGDPTLSAKEIIGNESQERMGLIMKQQDVDLLQRIAQRERAPCFRVGEVTDDGYFKIENNGQTSPINLKIDHMFGHPPKTIIIDQTIDKKFKQLDYEVDHLHQYLNQVLQLEAVACKDWLTNKADRSVTGKVAKQQTAGSLQLPLNDVSAMALDYQGVKGMATSIGHASVAGLIDAKAGSRLSLAEALTNLVWAPLTSGIKGVSLSANWMWPSKNMGEDARLYHAVEALSDFACELGINIPTGKDSLSMKQKYPDGKEVISPGTVIISAVAEVSDVSKIVEPVIIADVDSHLIYLDLSQTEYQLGGSSFSQILSQLGSQAPDIKDPKYFMRVFGVLQQLINEGKVLAGHDISAGGMITTLLEMVFPGMDRGLDVNLDQIPEPDIIKLLFSENPGIIFQVKDLQYIENIFNQHQLTYYVIGKPASTKQLVVHHQNNAYYFEIDELRDTWYKTSFLLDTQQTAEGFAQKRFINYKKQELSYQFSSGFTGQFEQFGIDPYRRENSGIKAAIIREKGVNGDREMAYALYLAGFDVKDIHMTDLVSGAENLEDVKFVVFVGGFSNSDVLGSAKGWAGAFLFNSKAKKTLDNFYQRSDTLSLGVCNGCQLMAELGLIYPHHEVHPQLLPNQSGKFESAFINVDIQQNHSVMLHSLAGSRLGIWVAHGEGRFKFPYQPEKYHIAAKYSYSDYPGNPNSSDWDVACIYSEDGRHLALMPHLERSFFPWQWPYYSKNRKNDQITPWIEAFVNAREWVKNKNLLPIAEKANH